MTTRNWIPFNNTWPKYDPKEMRISLMRNGELSFSNAAFHALRSPAAIALFYDRTAGLIGVNAVDPNASNAIAVRKHSRGRKHIAAIGWFLTNFGLSRPSNAIRFPKPAFDPDGTLVLNYLEAVKAISADPQEARGEERVPHS